MRRFAILVVTGALAAACAGGTRAVDRPPAPAPAPKPTTAGAPELRGPEAFAGIADRAQRSRALFLEATRVMLHPRCVNCHPAGDSPHQRDEMTLHDPPVTRGDHDRGVPAMECTSCHQEKNLELARVPGAPSWHLAPREMAWQGKTAAEVCEQVKDPARNGHRTLAQIADHAAHDELVAWGWSPGSGRTPAPGTQARFGALVQAWIDTGAACPTATREAAR